MNFKIVQELWQHNIPFTRHWHLSSCIQFTMAP